MLTDVQAREAVHVLVLKRLREESRPESFVLKGGVNLRLFFQSPRYSEDMDLDVEPSARRRHQVIDTVSGILKGTWLQGRLRAIGLQGVEYSGRPHKDTDTTVQIKLQVLNRAGIALPTRIEMSLRGRDKADTAIDECVDRAIVGAYVAEEPGDLSVVHYPLNSAARQKINALARRSAPETRDVFDLHVLARGEISSLDIGYLRRGLPEPALRQARDRALELGYDAFRDQVSEFLSDADQARLGTRDHWETTQLFVVDLMDVVLAMPAPAVVPEA